MCFLDSTDLNNLFGPGEFNAGVKAVTMAVHKLRKGAHKNEAQEEMSGWIELVWGAPVPKSKLLGPEDGGPEHVLLEDQRVGAFCDEK